MHLYEINECKAIEVCKTIKNTFYIHIYKNDNKIGLVYSLKTNGGVEI